MPSSPQALSLSELQSGETCFLLSFITGKKVTSRLASLGFTPGVQMTMTQNFGHGPLLVTVRGTCVALGRGEARHILVQRSA